MCENERQMFCKKLTDELKLFKLEKMYLSMEEIYHSAFEIDAMLRIYELMVEKAETMDLCLVRKLIYLPELLKCFYQVWLRTEDSSTEELEAALETYLAQIGKKGGDVNEKTGIIERDFS